MWIHLDGQELLLAAAALMAKGDAPSLALSVKFRETLANSMNAENLALLESYKTFVESCYVTQHQDGDVDLDDVVTIAPGEDGAYVMAWLWASNEDMGIDTV